jgi:hemerythrin-like domain-containing protein
MNRPIRVLLDKHRSISAVLSGFHELMRMAQLPGVIPKFEVFWAMIYYMDEFPERLHHPREDGYLFARLAQRSEEARPLIAELSVEHAIGRRLVRELERALLSLTISWPNGIKEFAATVGSYTQFHWDHMRKEERLLLPLAQLNLTAEDWKTIDQAFLGNEDPIAGMGEKDYAQLFKRIVSLAPNPVGLGDHWKSAS